VTVWWGKKAMKRFWKPHGQEKRNFKSVLVTKCLEKGVIYMFLVLTVYVGVDEVQQFFIEDG
jgi:hypothetical protein